MEIFLIWIIASLIVGAVAANRGRDRVQWTGAAILISPLLALVLVLCLTNIRAQKVADKRHAELLAALAGRDPSIIDGNAVRIEPTLETYTLPLRSEQVSPYQWVR